MKREHPNMQLHRYVSWEFNLWLTLTTSLLTNYPSPMFTTLPIKPSVTGLVFEGQLAVSYQGEKKRVHLCILDEPIRTFLVHHIGTEIPEFQGKNQISIFQSSCLPPKAGRT